MKIKDLIKIIGTVSTILILLFGVSLVTVFKKAKVIVQYPEHRRELIDNDSVMSHQIHDLIHSQEFTWDLLRLMTDNTDSTILRQITDENGIDHDVDIRETAEGVQLAFVFDYFVVFQIRSNPADNRQFISVHDYETGESQKYYLK
jgi:hypothetical protein